MEESKSITLTKYFAAANSYNGFISYFDEVFYSKNFSRVYVLKGGPGTGKSSFMKKIARNYESKECEIEEIFCSSDPTSLDGVIVRNGDRSIAILDGTSPHERDALYPGAIDEIINLGSCWDSRILIAQRNEIYSLGAEKSENYKTAYNYLKIAGQANSIKRKLYDNIFDIFKIKNKAESILNGISPSKNSLTSTRLISSFGRQGAYRIDALEGMKINKLFIDGDEYSAGMLLSCCANILKENKSSFLKLISPLDPELIEGIIIPDHSLAILCGRGEINADELFDYSHIDHERIKASEWIKAEALEEAKRWFAIASDLHFRLEEIYSDAMHFEKINEMLEVKLKEIDNILEII